MSEAIEVLGVEAKRSERAPYAARTPLGEVQISRGLYGWEATWWPRHQRSCVSLLNNGITPADAAREATRRLRAIQRTCARAGAV